MTRRVGVDIGGTSIKAGLVDTRRGSLVGAARRVRTPRPATPGAVAAAVDDLIGPLAADHEVGCGFPGVVRKGITATAANLHPDWIGTDAQSLLSGLLQGQRVAIINDADAAGRGSGPSIVEADECR